MFATMRTAQVTQRGLDGSLNAKDVLEFATVDGAAACGLADRTGSLTPGKDADVILLNADDPTVFPCNNPAGTIVVAGHPGLVDTVLVAGQRGQARRSTPRRRPPDVEEQAGRVARPDRRRRRYPARRNMAPHHRRGLTERAYPMRRELPFAQVDVFSRAAYLGNPVAVILDADGLDDEDMLRMARWTNLSETTFVLSPTTHRADYRLRIFTPGGELPFAGHPTLGSAHAWLEHGGIPMVRDRLCQECEAGLVEVRRREGLLWFAAPPTRRSGDIEEEYLGQIVEAFGIDHDQVLAHQWVDNGPGWAVVRLATAQQVLDLQPDLTRIPTAMVGAIGAYPDGSEHAFELRTFAPGVGVEEDPVCGSMNASVAQWFLRTGTVSGGYRVSQGRRLDRAGDITITADTDGTIWVGGNTNTLFHGAAIAY